MRITTTLLYEIITIESYILFHQSEVNNARPLIIGSYDFDSIIYMYAHIFVYSIGGFMA